jgi:nucleoside-diphosphate-sugar epimerase
VQELLEGGRIERPIDVVMHLAVSRRHREFPEAALDMFNVIVAITAHLLDFARKAGVRRSSSAPPAPSTIPSARPVQHEDDALAPGSYFGLTNSPPSGWR